MDVDRYKDAELFSAKQNYDVQQRLREIESIVGKQVTVYEVAGKQNKVKLSYTGIAMASNVPKFSDKQKASLIVVQIKEANGQMGAYFPLTNSNRYKIYLAEKMK